MPDVRYICLSDLHFGAQNSLLTQIAPGTTRADPLVASPSLVAFVDCLDALIQTNEDQVTKPALILNGDILEFALASDEQAISTFERFVELALVERQLFSPTIHYLPGNHDHHLWETARERQYANYVYRHEPGSQLRPPWHATPMFAAIDKEVREKRRVEADLLNAVIHRFPALRETVVQVHYPNLGFRSGTSHAVVFHHGHYIESIYRLMSRLKVTLFPASPAALYPWDWEAENFAWVDFFWSTLGRSGQIGADVGLLYDMLQNPAAVRAVAHNLADAAVKSGQPRLLPPFLRRWGADKAINLVAGRISNLERSQPVIAARPDHPAPLTPAGVQGLRSYIEGPVALQLADENGGVVPDHVSFVFGHTHKPYEMAGGSYAGYRSPVAVYNTGGWVVDTLRADTRQGAAAVLIDENLTVASLRLYNQQLAGGEGAVAVHSADPEDNPFTARLRSSIRAENDPWSRLSRVVAEAIPERYACLQAIIDHGIQAAKARPAG